MTDLFAHALVINLELRKDRLDHATAELAKIGVVAERFNAVVHASGSGHLGCSESHLRCLERAKAENWPCVLICEDDITFTDPSVFLDSVRKFTSSHTEPESWDVLLLGGNMAPPFLDEVATKGCFRVQNIQTATGYVVNNHYYDKLLENFRAGLFFLAQQPELRFQYMIDMYWKRLQGRDRWFVLAPLTVIQYPNYSDLEKREVDYTSVMTRVVKPRKKWTMW